LMRLRRPPLAQTTIGCQEPYDELAEIFLAFTTYAVVVPVEATMVLEGAPMRMLASTAPTTTQRGKRSS